MLLLGTSSTAMRVNLSCAVQARMDEDFLKNRLKPGDPGYVWNKQARASASSFCVAVGVPGFEPHSD